MSNDTRDFIKRFALQNLNYYIGNLMDSNCRKTESTPQDIADCKAVRSSSIHVAENPDGFFDNSVRIAFETAGKEGWFGNYGSRQMSILFSQDGSFMKAELNVPHSFLLPNGGNIGVGCTAGVIRDLPTGDVAYLDAHSETNNDGSPDAGVLDGQELPPEDMSVEDVADAAADLAGDATGVGDVDLPLDVTSDTVDDVAADVAEDTTIADGTELPPDMSVDDTVDTEDTVQDAGLDLADDATADDGVELPPDAMSTDTTVPSCAGTKVPCSGIEFCLPSGILFGTNADMNDIVVPDSNAFATQIYLTGMKVDLYGAGTSVDVNDPTIKPLDNFANPLNDPISLTLQSLQPMGVVGTILPVFSNSKLVFSYNIMESNPAITGQYSWTAADSYGKTVKLLFDPTSSALDILYVGDNNQQANYHTPVSEIPNPYAPKGWLASCAGGK